MTEHPNAIDYLQSPDNPIDPKYRLILVGLLDCNGDFCWDLVGYRTNTAYIRFTTTRPGATYHIIVVTSIGIDGIIVRPCINKVWCSSGFIVVSQHGMRGELLDVIRANHVEFATSIESRIGFESLRADGATYVRSDVISFLSGCKSSFVI